MNKHQHPPSRPTSILKAAKLAKHFKDRIAVNNIDFEVQEGECLGFLGPNGAGKTTTIQIVLGMIEKTSGALTIFDKPHPANIREIKMKTGVVPQNDNLDPDLTVAENLLTYASYYNINRKTARARSDELLSFFALESRRNDVIDHLSGGQRRRLLLARALIHRPSLLILDEPTVGLDPQARILIWERLKSLKEQKITIILTSHYMDEVARLSDRILILDRGAIVAQGKPQQLIRDLVGLDVFEVNGPETELKHLEKTALGCEATCERTSEALLIYTSKECEELEHQVRTCSTWLRRPANLEDLFIRLTGKSLQE